MISRKTTSCLADGKVSVGISQLQVPLASKRTKIPPCLVKCLISDTSAQARVPLLVAFQSAFPKAHIHWTIADGWLVVQWNNLTVPEIARQAGKCLRKLLISINSKVRSALAIQRAIQELPAVLLYHCPALSLDTGPPVVRKLGYGFSW